MKKAFFIKKLLYTLFLSCFILIVISCEKKKNDPEIIGKSTELEASEKAVKKLNEISPSLDNQSGINSSMAFVCTKDEGYVIVHPEDRGIKIFKTTASGDIDWQVIHKESDLMISIDEIIEMSDECIVLAGNIEDRTEWNSDLFFLKLSPDGKILQSRIHHINDKDVFMYSINETSDGGFILGGHMVFKTDVILSDLGQTGVIKLNESGELSWVKTFESSETEGGQSIIEINNGEYLMIGNNSTSPIFFKIDKNGDIISKVLFETAALTLSKMNDILPANDGGYIITGWEQRYSDNADSTSFLTLYKVNDSGNILWKADHSFDGKFVEPFSINKLFSTGYYAIVRESVEGWPRHFIVKFNNNGELVEE